MNQALCFNKIGYFLVIMRALFNRTKTLKKGGNQNIRLLQLYQGPFTTER